MISFIYLSLSLSLFILLQLFTPSFAALGPKFKTFGVLKLRCPREISLLKQCPSDFEDKGYCSYRQDLKTGVTTETYTANKCSACQDSQAYSQGECKGKKVFCDIYNDPPTLCPSKEEPVCGFDLDIEEDEIAKVGTFRNGCYACQAQVDYYVKGKCEILNSKRKI